MGKRTSRKTISDMFDNAENSQTENTETAAVPAEVIAETDVIAAAPLADGKSYTAHIRKINDALLAIKKSFFKIAYALEWIDATSAYEFDGYENIESFARDCFGIGRTSTYNYIHVARRFGTERDADTGEISSLKDPYRMYSPTQLIILYDSGLDDQQIEELGIDSTLTCAEIKNRIRGLSLMEDKPKNNNSDNGTPDNGITDSGAPDSGTDKTPDGKREPAGDKAHYARTNSLLTVTSLEDFDRQKNDILDLIRKTLSQDGFQCAVTISMSWN